MEKIEVDEWIRLKYGKIEKVKNNDYYMQQYIECEKGLYPKENIVKHSKNKIDIIEVGDYVNGYEVLNKYLFNGEKPVLETNGEEINHKYLCNSDIKNTVTHEQFESIKYNFKEE